MVQRQVFVQYVLIPDNSLCSVVVGILTSSAVDRGFDPTVESRL